MSFPLAKQSVVLVGGTSGMGLACARALLAEGAEVLVASRSGERVTAALQELAGARGGTADTADPASLAALFADGPVDHVVCTAGTGASGALADLTDDSFASAWHSKVLGQLHVAQAARLRPGGSLTLFSGLFGTRVAAGNGATAAANAGVEALARTLALELAPLRVNVIRPGLVETPAYAAMPEAARRRMLDGAGASLPAGRVGRPEDVVPIVLACLTSGYLTGSVLGVDGGAGA